MGNYSRTKSLNGERQAAEIWTRAGLTVRNLEGIGDHLILTGDGVTIHEEVKRQERPRLNEWWKQAVAEAPQGTIPVVTFRPSYAPWLSVLDTGDLATLVAAGHGRIPRVHVPRR